MTFIYLTIASLLVFIALVSFRHYIYLIWIRLLYGIYDTRYMVLINEKAYCESPYYVKGELSDQINKIKLAIRSTEKNKTDKPLFFQNIQYGISTQDLVALIGRPASSGLVDMNDLKVVSMEYNLNPNNVVDKYIYYFYNDKYYLGEFIFNKIGTETSDKILNNINLKYNTDFGDSDEFLLINKSHNCLKYNNLGFSISVTYFNRRNNEVLQLLDNFNIKMENNRSVFDYQLNVKELSF